MNSKLIIAIGASTGGPFATIQVLKGLAKNSPPIVITQHMLDNHLALYKDNLEQSVDFKVNLAKTGDVLAPGNIYLAPGGRNLSVQKSPKGYIIRCLKPVTEMLHCPNVDVMFNSVAKSAKGYGIGVILTGMGNDGAKGLLKIKEQGGYTLAQEEKDCCVYGMPKVACQLGAVSQSLSLEQIPIAINKYVKTKDS